MSTSAVITIVVVVIAAIAIALLVVNQRSKRLRKRFGPEYSRTVEETGSRIRAEAKLQKLQKRVEQFKITPLSSETRTRFVAGWHKIQSRFVDDPRGALTEADRLIQELMSERGYPVTEFEQRAAETDEELTIADLAGTSQRMQKDDEASRIENERRSIERVDVRIEGRFTGDAGRGATPSTAAVPAPAMAQETGPLFSGSEAERSSREVGCDTSWIRRRAAPRSRAGRHPGRGNDEKARGNLRGRTQQTGKPMGQGRKRFDVRFATSCKRFHIKRRESALLLKVDVSEAESGCATWPATKIARVEFIQLTQRSGRDGGSFLFLLM